MNPLKNLRFWRSNTPKTFEPPPQLDPSTEKWRDAMLASRRRERLALKLAGVAVVVGGFAGTWAFAVTMRDIDIGERIARLMNEKNVYVLRERPDGEQSFYALDKTVNVQDGDRWEEAIRFAEWSRRISMDKIVMLRERDKIEARISEPMKGKFAAEIDADFRSLLGPDAKGAELLDGVIKHGWQRDITDLVALEKTEKGNEENGVYSITVMWREHLFKNFKPIPGGTTLYSRIVYVRDVKPRPGALNGVEIVGASLPTPVPETVKPKTS